MSVICLIHQCQSALDKTSVSLSFTSSLFCITSMAFINSFFISSTETFSSPLQALLSDANSAAAVELVSKKNDKNAIKENEDNNLI